MTKTIADHVRTHVDETPKKVFWRQLSGGTVNETDFDTFYRKASSFAHACEQVGAEPGQPVLIFLPHSVDAVAAFFGAILAGAVPSFMPCPSAKQHPSVYWPGHAKLLQRIGPHLLLTDRQHARQMGEHGLAAAAGSRIVAVEDVGHDDRPYAPARRGADSVALLQHSSGTTALKKGVALSHRAILRQVELYSARLEMGGDDSVVTWLPLYHDMGLIACTITPLVLGQTVTSLDPFEWVARPGSLLDAIGRYDGRFAWMPNFGFEHLVRAVPDTCAADLSGVRALVNCSEPCLPSTFDRFQRKFAHLGVRPEQLQVCYAMAETVFAVSQTQAGQPARAIAVDRQRLHRDRVAVEPNDATGPSRLLSTGRPLPGLEVRIRQDGRDLADNEVGEVVVSGEIVFDGYFNDPETTGARVREGWYHTRDLGFMRDGELYILGRQDDLMIINGRNLHAHEVEGLIAGVPGVKPGRAVAFGIFNDDIGSEELVLVAERDAGSGAASDQDVSRAVRAAIYDQTNIEVKACSVVEPGWLVKTTSGKISREANRAKYLNGSAAFLPASDRVAHLGSRTFGRLADFISAFFKCPRDLVQRQTVAGDVEGWDSLAHATLILAVEREFRVNFADSEIFGFEAVGNLADRIDELLAEGGGKQLVDRVVHRSDAASIVRLGESDGPDIIVFAGKEENFGGLAVMDFSSLFAQTSAADTTKFYVTDLHQDWYTTCFDEVAAKVNVLSSKPKIIFGNSMGGYGALRFATVLSNVIGVLAFVPQVTAPLRHVRARGKPGDYWDVQLLADIPYCIVYGEAEDEPEKAYIRQQVRGRAWQQMHIVPNCGHNLPVYLNDQQLLASVIECCLKPETMGDEIGEIVTQIRPVPGALSARAAQLAAKKERLVAQQIRAKARAGSPSAPGMAASGMRLPGPQRGEPRVKVPKTFAERFAKANVSGDGRLTREQALSGLPFVGENFDKIDLHKRGYVTLSDIGHYHRSLPASDKPVPRPPVPE